MDMFRKLNEMENSIRRGDAFRAFKPITEKMGEPVIMGGDDSTTPACTDDSEKCASLMSALHMYDSAKIGGVKKCNDCGCEKDEVVADMVIKPAMEDAGEEEKAEDIPVANQGESSAPAPDSPMAADEDKYEDCASYKDIFGADADEDAFRKSMDEAYEKAVAALEPEEFEGDEEGKSEVVDGENDGDADDEAGEEGAGGDEMTGEDDNEEVSGEEVVDDNYTAKSLFGDLFEKAKKKQKKETVAEAKAKQEDTKRAAQGKSPVKKPDFKAIEAKRAEDKKAAADKKDAAPKKTDSAESDEQKKGKTIARKRGLANSVTAADAFGNKVDPGLFGASAGHGRTHRQRRTPGEIWMGRYGTAGAHQDKMVAWTKFENQSIERVKKYDKDGNPTPAWLQIQDATAHGWTGADPLGHKAEQDVSERHSGKRKSTHVEKIPVWVDMGLISAEALAMHKKACKDLGVPFSESQMHALLAYRRMLAKKATRHARTVNQLKTDLIHGVDQDQFKTADGKPNKQAFDAFVKRVGSMSDAKFAVLLSSIFADDEDGAAIMERHQNDRANAGMGEYMGKSFDTQLEAILKSMN